jgi:ABC-2 type transport system permease protein
MLFIYGLIVGVFLGAARSIPDFMLFIFVGLIAWNLFTTIITGSIASISSNGSLMSKNRFPRILLPLASVVVALVDTAIQLLVLMIGYAIVGSWPTLANLHYAVLAFVGIVLCGLAFGLMLSAINVYIPDVGYLTEIALQVGFWLCPILYSYSFVVNAAESYGYPSDLVSRLYMLNPMANTVIGFQQGLWPPASSVGVSLELFPGNLDLRLWTVVVAGGALVAFVIALFNRLARNFAQELA